MPARSSKLPPDVLWDDAMRRYAPYLLSLILCGCSTPEVVPDAPKSSAPAAAPPAAVDKPDDAPKATVGQPAPDFDLPTLDGGRESLSKYKGKIVVLEWFNPDCPFVKQSHTEGTLKGMAAKHPDVVWLAINSNKPGSQGSSQETNEAGRKNYGITYPVLFDADGRVGQAYGATNTPHMYVIDEAGVLRYAGALDNTKGGDVEDVDTLQNYVADAIAAVKAKTEVAVKETQAWGCTVKYASR